MADAYHSTPGSFYDLSLIMKRAWVLHRTVYAEPGCAYQTMGRTAFGYALRQAWNEAREAARFKAIPIAEREARIEQINGELGRVIYISNWREAQAREDRLRRELRCLTIGFSNGLRRAA